MNYLCLIYRDVATRADFFPGLDGRGFHWAESRQLEMNSLHPVHEAITIRVRGNQVAIAEGARAHSHDSLAEFCLIQARDLNDAIRIAARLPPAQLGKIEIRGIASDPVRGGEEQSEDEHIRVGRPDQ